MFATTPSDDRYAILRDQATALEAEFPELFAELVERDRILNRTLARIPHPTDIENSATFDLWRHNSTYLFGLAPGLADLARPATPTRSADLRWTRGVAGR